MADEKLAILYRPELQEYDFGPGHPFRGDRYRAFPGFLEKHFPSDDNYRIIAAEPATDSDLRLICRQEYIDFTRNFFNATSAGLDYPANFYLYRSADNAPIGKPGKIETAARLIIGQAKKACDLVEEGKFEKVISLGGGMHHAKPGYGEGFCLYNDVAFCGIYLMSRHKLDRILILDTDAHAGNGTAEYFYQEPSVLFIDVHQDPMTLYPGTGFSNQTGSEQGKGFTINIPLPVFAGYESYRLAFEAIIEPVVREFKPQIIIRNGGSDPHFADGLTNLGLPVKGFSLIGERVREIARQVCQGRVIDLIGSGYNDKVLPRSWLALITALAGIELDIEESVSVPPEFSRDRVLPQTTEVIREVREQLKDYWQCLR